MEANLITSGQDTDTSTPQGGSPLGALAVSWPEEIGRSTPGPLSGAGVSAGDMDGRPPGQPGHWGERGERRSRGANVPTTTESRLRAHDLGGSGAMPLFALGNHVLVGHGTVGELHDGTHASDGHARCAPLGDGCLGHIEVGGQRRQSAALGIKPVG